PQPKRNQFPESSTVDILKRLEKQQQLEGNKKTLESRALTQEDEVLEVKVLRTTPEMQERLRYLDSTLGSASGNEYYENLCMKALYPLLGRMQTEIRQANLVTLKKKVFLLLNFFVKQKRTSQMDETLIDFTTPNSNANGAVYIDSLTAQLFSISVLPKNQNGPYEFSGDFALDSRHTDPSLWECMANHQNSLFTLIKQLLMQDANNKQKMLEWFAKFAKTKRK
ncbi:hypothetical protein GQX74_011100, partial [Glossina fuscipes]